MVFRAFCLALRQFTRRPATRKCDPLFWKMPQQYPAQTRTGQYLQSPFRIVWEAAGDYPRALKYSTLYFRFSKRSSESRRKKLPKWKQNTKPKRRKRKTLVAPHLRTSASNWNWKCRRKTTQSAHYYRTVRSCFIYNCCRLLTFNRRKLKYGRTATKSTNRKRTLQSHHWRREREMLARGTGFTMASAKCCRSLLPACSWKKHIAPAEKNCMALHWKYLTTPAWR